MSKTWEFTYHEVLDDELPGVLYITPSDCVRTAFFKLRFDAMVKTIASQIHANLNGVDYDFGFIILPDRDEIENLVSEAASDEDFELYRLFELEDFRQVNMYGLGEVIDDMQTELLSRVAFDVDSAEAWMGSSCASLEAEVPLEDILELNYINFLHSDKWNFPTQYERDAFEGSVEEFERAVYGNDPDRAVSILRNGLADDLDSYVRGKAIDAVSAAFVSASPELERIYDELEADMSASPDYYVFEYDEYDGLMLISPFN